MFWKSKSFICHILQTPVRGRGSIGGGGGALLNKALYERLRPEVQPHLPFYEAFQGVEVTDNGAPKTGNNTLWKHQQSR